MQMRQWVAASLTALAAGTASAGDNLLNNASFENPLGFDFSDLTNWNGFFGGPGGTFLQAFNDTGATPHSGERALVTTISGVEGVTDGFNAFTGHVQFVSGITAGANYEFAVWARSNPTISDGAEFRIEWQNAAGVELSRLNVEIQDLLNGDYNRFAINAIAPDGAARAALVVAVQSFYHTGPIANTSVAWDDASFTVVPAPACGALLGLGLLAAGRRRR